MFTSPGYSQWKVSLIHYDISIAVPFTECIKYTTPQQLFNLFHYSSIVHSDVSNPASSMKSFTQRCPIIILIHQHAKETENQSTAEVHFKVLFKLANSQTARSLKPVWYFPYSLVLSEFCITVWFFLCMIYVIFLSCDV